MGRKWNPDAKPSEKLLALYTILLFSNRDITLTELSHELNCSKQTVSRLIDQLEASRFGKLLRLNRGREAAYRLDRPGKLPPVSLNADGFYQLALCRDFMLHLLPASVKLNVNSALRHASMIMPEGEPLAAIRQIGGSLSKGRIDYTPFQEILRTMITAITKGLVCSVGYNASIRDEPKDFEYAPKRLIAYHESIRISGWVVSPNESPITLYDKPTNFLLHRITRASLTKRSAKLLPEIDDRPGAFGLMSDEPFVATVRFDESAATYVAEREWSLDQKIEQESGGGIVLTMTAQNTPEFASWVLSFGAAAEVLSPQWLRSEICERVREMAALYNLLTNS